jgi:hypothetical protein
MENEPRTLAIEVLARLIVQAICADQKPEQEHDCRPMHGAEQLAPV